MCIVCGPGREHLLRAIVNRHAARPRAAGRLIARRVAPSVIAPLDPFSAADLAGPADVILRGGAILTMVDQAPTADAIAVRAGRIQAVGSEATALAHRGRLTRIIDLQGRALLPGFVNAHWHMPLTLLCAWEDATQAGSVDTAASALDAACVATPAGEWIVLSVNATLATLLSNDTAAFENVASSHPVVVTDPNGRVVAGNLSAAAFVGQHVSALLPRFVARLAISTAPIRTRLAKMLEQTAAAGVTCLRVCGLGSLSGADDLDLMRDVMSESPRLRLRATMDATLLAEWRDQQLTPGFGDDLFRADTVSAWLHDGTAPQLADARQAGWRVTLHASDEAEIEAALRCFESTRAAGATFDTGCGIECRDLPTPEQLLRMRRLGLSLGMTGNEQGPPVSPTDFPLSLGLDAASGPSPPLAMLRNAAGLGLPRALAAITRNAAARCGAGTIIGTLERGKYADFVFLNRDPRTAPGVELRCTSTWLNGQEMFRA